MTNQPNSLKCDLKIGKLDPMPEEQSNTLNDYEIDLC